MSNYNGRKAPNVSQYIANLNTIPSEADLAAQENFAGIEDDLAMFTNTQFFDFDMGESVNNMPGPVGMGFGEQQKQQQRQNNGHEGHNGMNFVNRESFPPLITSTLHIREMWDYVHIVDLESVSVAPMMSTHPHSKLYTTNHNEAPS